MIIVYIFGILYDLIMQFQPLQTAKTITITTTTAEFVLRSALCFSFLCTLLRMFVCMQLCTLNFCNTSRALQRQRLRPQQQHYRFTVIIIYSDQNQTQIKHAQFKMNALLYISMYIYAFAFPFSFFLCAHSQTN